MKYIDVSEWQGAIEWDKVKGNIDGVMLRAGYGKNHIDKTFDRNAKECNRLKIPCGAYWFSYAKTAQEAEDEARYLLATVKPYRMELPLAYDFEYDSAEYAQMQGVTVTKPLASEMTRRFCNAVEAAGYWALFYANPDYLNRYFDATLPERYGLWLASWPTAKVFDVANPPRKCAIWQWGGSAVPGISGSVDTNEAYQDFATIIKNAGMNRLGYADGDSVVYEYTSDPKPVQVDPAETALKWAQELHIVEGDNETDKAVALALWRYHCIFTEADDKKDSGLLT